MAEIQSSTNFLQDVGFHFDCRFLPSLSDWIQQVNLPGIMNNEVKTPSPFITINQGGDSLRFETLQIEFKVDENMQNWTEVFDWMIATAPTEDFVSRANWLKKNATVLAPGVLTILNNSAKPILRFSFDELSPVALGGMKLRSNAEGIQYVSSYLDLSFTKYRYERV